MPDIGVYKVVADNGKEKIETKANIDVCGMFFDFSFQSFKNNIF
jgi:hypothetical protein